MLFFTLKRSKKALLVVRPASSQPEVESSLCYRLKPKKSRQESSWWREDSCRSCAASHTASWSQIQIVILFSSVTWNPLSQIPKEFHTTAFSVVLNIFAILFSVKAEIGYLATLVLMGMLSMSGIVCLRLAALFIRYGRTKSFSFLLRRPKSSLAFRIKELTRGANNARLQPDFQNYRRQEEVYFPMWEINFSQPKKIRQTAWRRV